MKKVNQNINIIVTDSAHHLGKKISRQSDIKVLFAMRNREGNRFFPDGEIYAKLPLEKLSGRVIVLHSGAPKPNEGLMELEIILAILKKTNISPELFFTYFPYAMQDKVFQYGEVDFAFSLLDKFLEFFHAQKISIIDPHFILSSKARIESISPKTELIEMARRFYPQTIFLAPDHGGSLRTGLPNLEKKRLDSYRVQFEIDEKLKEKIRGKIVAIVDDILETGSTLVKIHELLKKAGAKKIIAIVTHAVLKEGIDRVIKKFDKLLFTNSVNQSGASLDISNLIIQTIEKG